jgi:hypothetical protein
MTLLSYGVIKERQKFTISKKNLVTMSKSNVKTAIIFVHRGKKMHLFFYFPSDIFEYWSGRFFSLMIFQCCGSRSESGRIGIILPDPDTYPFQANNSTLGLKLGPNIYKDTKP